MAGARRARARRSQSPRRYLFGSAQPAASSQSGRLPIETAYPSLIVHDFCAFLVLFPGPKRGHLFGQRRRTMKIRTVIGAACAAIAIATAAPATAHDAGDKVTPIFEQAIPNVPGKSLIALT